MDRVKFGDLFKQYRQKAGLSQGDIAKALKYKNAQFVSNWERNVSFPPRKALEKACKMIGANYREMSLLLIGEHIINESKKLRKRFGIK